MKDIVSKHLKFTACFLLLFCSLRGLVPLLLEDGDFAYPSIYLSFLMGVYISLWGLKRACQVVRNDPFYLLSKIMIINLIVSFLWVIPNFFSGDRSQVINFVYRGLFPCSIFIFIRLTEKTIVRLLGVIAILISFSIVWDSYEMNLLPYPAGYFKVYYRQLILRPDTLDFFGSTSGIFRSGGLLGIRPHESGSLLAVVITLFLGLGIRSKSLLPKEFLIVFLISIGFILSQSASNIIAAIVGIVFLFFVSRKNPFTRDRFLTFFPVIMLITVLKPEKVIDIIVSFLGKIAKRVSPDYAGWKGMTRVGMTDNPIMDLLELILDFCSVIGRCNAPHSEVELLNLFTEFGLVYFSLFVSLLLFPLGVFFFRKNSNLLCTPYISAIFVGFVTLWHYATIIRTSNIFIFYSIYALALKILYSKNLIFDSQKIT
ncbi:hypothetical protein [Leptospira interrogans]|uniref:Uncharacterized protein n=1 Tax=Leptospira interrogans serovar Bataviae TaxID=312175 RepID=A0AAP9WIN9_LEPIR|nr:hypothetical protein [Leptospira interrogans]EKR25176.1 putative membrane protein [Leptospira interrogans serovar Bataviae str. L1111]MCR8648652.1 hypothetical protein [Leptospira interrogans serovar Bataviae]OAM73308.1 hypothetical protein A1343_10525 [Leptospira interrogans serovar Bataviae]QOI38155.1 hypothetical protein Lepto1548_07615 [Leptospira interrogans serovar Bataviae]QOI50279.1 hypothetical protein Lepto1489_07360 [Leptospira interrogans serovar Bataviae]